MDSPAMIALGAVTCASCGDHDAARMLRGLDWFHQRSVAFAAICCRRCGLVFQNPRPTPDSTALFYPADYVPHDTPQLPLPLHTLLQRTDRALLDSHYGSTPRPLALLTALLLPLDWLYRTLNYTLIPFQHNGCLLFVGRGSGGYLLSVRALAWQVVGAKISSGKVRLAPDSFRPETHVADLRDAMLPAGHLMWCPWDATWN